MHKDRLRLVYSPSDLNAFLENECITWLDRYDREFPGVLVRDEATEEEDEVVQGACDVHKWKVLAAFQEQGDVANHQGLANRIISPEAGHLGNRGVVQRRQRLGGMLNYYFRAAA